MNRALRLTTIAAGVLIVAGTALTGFGIGRALHPPAPATSASDVYTESQQCSGCPAGTRIDSVEVESRVGSTLVVLRGQWPASVDALKTSVCLTVNTLNLTLKPHGSRNVFEPTITTAGGAPAVPATAIAAGLQGSALLVDVSSSAGLVPPLLLHVALCGNGQTLQRLPRSGELVWSGHGAPQPQALASASASPSVRATASPLPAVSSTPTATTAGLDPAAQPRTCSAIPSGTVPPYLTPTGSSSRVETDPRTQAPTQQVTVAMSANPAGIHSPAYAIVAVVLPAGAAAPPARGVLVDRAGTVQLYAFTDGTSLHKAIRSFDGATWHALVDSDATALTLRLGPAGVSFFYTGMHRGDRFGFVTAAASGCASLGMSAAMAPQLSIA
ncbi:MAG TPA: hypothetical protein VGQ42_09725 [Candidatus Dormibacteraeota bacterium]|nr:hypothetical protein [Candidatus Dormibacteraeota bacterium]